MNVSEVDPQLEALTREGQTIRDGVDKLRKVLADFDQQRLVLAELRARSLLEAQLLTHQLQLLAVGGLVDELRETLKRVGALIREAERKLDIISATSTGTVRLTDEIGRNQ